ncbi:MAG: arginine repressor [Bacteroidaceae bacterium]|nr:arginine repressor [Bacteroidaceae bacterium]
MGKKDTRLEVIKMIISSQELSKQEELMAELDKAGFTTTQATLSRDLRLLKVVKAQNAEGRYVYMLPSSRIYRSVSDNHMTVMAMNRLGALGIKFSGNMAVVKTLPGHAAHVAYDIDKAELPCVLGTVAGEDTVFIVLEEGTEREEALNAISQALPMNK